MKLNYQTKSLEDQITNATNMVEITHVLADVSQFYLNEFAATVRKLDRAIETQDHYLTDFNNRYGAKVKEDRARLIDLIPSRFHNCEMYKTLIVS